MERVNLKFAKVRPEGIIPTKKDGDAGYDVYADWITIFNNNRFQIGNDHRMWEDKALVRTIKEKDELHFFILFPNQTFLFPTGIASSCSESYYFQIQERGSTGSKGIKYGAGVIDSSYRGEWFIPITNANSRPIAFYDDKKISPQPEDRVSFISDENRNLYEDYLNLYKENLWWSITGKEWEGFPEEDFIFYPMSKAIAQFVLLPVPKTEIEEITFEELQAIPSTRGDGALGSSGK